MLRTLMICTTLALSACASTQGTPTATRPDVAKNTVNSNCVASASRIPQNDCIAPGQSYTQQEIQSTGQVNVGQALQMLDPSLAVHQ